jgi:carbamoyltransferase
MNVLGINAVFHESAAALLVDGKVVAACEEERFNRVKHAKQSRVDNPHELPEHAIRFCLEDAGLKASAIDRVAYSFDPQLRRAEYSPAWWPDPGMEAQFLRCLGEVGNAVEGILGRKAAEALHLASHEYMLFACPTKAGRGERIPAVIHQDGTARVQLVRRGSNPRFHELISHFFARTGVPLVLNTSFNDSEPIVCTPAHAIATFRSTGIDALFMGDIYLTSDT